MNVGAIDAVIVRCLAIAAVAWSTSMPAARAGAFEDGVAAYDQGQFEKAFELWLPLAQGGNAVVQFNLAALYEKGTGVPQDLKEAARWYLEAAKHGDIDAQMKIADFYEQGTGVAKDAAAARDWYRAVVASPQSTRDAMASKEKARTRLSAIAGVTQEVIPYDYGRYVVVRGAGDTCVIALQGAITTDTRLKFDDVVAQSRKMGCAKPVLMLESPGGGVVDGISIGKEVRAQGMQTVSRYDCASACGLIFMGGVERVLVGSRARIGLHQAASGNEQRRHCSSVAEGNGMPEIRRYLAWAVPATGAEVMKVIQDTPCDTITWVSGERSLALGVATRVEAESNDTSGPKAPQKQ